MIACHLTGMDVPIDELPIVVAAGDVADQLVGVLVDDVIADDGGSDVDADIAVIELVDAGIAVDTFKPAVVRGCTVMFDHYSHSSGVQRGYIRCPMHDRCFRYTSVSMFRSRTRLCAYLMAWRALGDTIDRESHQSRSCQPDERAISAFEPDVVL